MLPGLLLAALLPLDARALTPAAELALDRGLEALYNLDYDDARARFRELIQAEPGNPYGYLFEAGSIWWQSSNEYGLFKDTPTLEGLFEQDIEDAIDNADKLFDHDDKKVRAEARFAAGMALGTRGQWHLMRGHWMKAYFDGKKAIKHLNKCVKLDPALWDVYLGLGVYDYQAARLPGILKLGALLGVRGDEKRGIERMRTALEKGRFSRRQAAQFLLSIYLLDYKSPQDALPLIATLRDSFPASPYFQFLDITTRYSVGDFDGSLAQARDLFEKSAGNGLLDRKQMTLFCGLAGVDCMGLKDLTAGVEWLHRALKQVDPKKDASWATTLTLYRGLAHDMLNQRSLALDDYTKVMSLPDFSGSRDRVKRCLLAACTRDEVVRQLRQMTMAHTTPIALPPGSTGPQAH